MTPTPTEKLAELMQQKRRVLTQLHQVGARQGELVDSGDVGTLLKLLAAKQRLLGGLQAIERGLEPYRDEDPEARAWASPGHRAACAEDAQACRQLLAEVVEMERVHERSMTERRDEVATQLQRAHTAHDATGAYRAHRSPAGGGASAPVAAAENQASAGIDLTSEA